MEQSGIQLDAPHPISASSASAAITQSAVGACLVGDEGRVSPTSPPLALSCPLSGAQLQPLDPFLRFDLKTATGANQEEEQQEEVPLCEEPFEAVALAGRDCSVDGVVPLANPSAPVLDPLEPSLHVYSAPGEHQTKEQPANAVESDVFNSNVPREATLEEAVTSSTNVAGSIGVTNGRNTPVDEPCAVEMVASAHSVNSQPPVAVDGLWWTGDGQVPIGKSSLPAEPVVSPSEVVCPAMMPDRSGELPTPLLPPPPAAAAALCVEASNVALPALAPVAPPMPHQPPPSPDTGVDVNTEVPSGACAASDAVACGVASEQPTAVPAAAPVASLAEPQQAGAVASFRPGTVLMFSDQAAFGTRHEEALLEDAKEQTLAVVPPQPQSQLASASGGASRCSSAAEVAVNAVSSVGTPVVPLSPSSMVFQPIETMEAIMSSAGAASPSNGAALPNHPVHTPIPIYHSPPTNLSALAMPRFASPKTPSDAVFPIVSPSNSSFHEYSHSSPNVDVAMSCTGADDDVAEDAEAAETEVAEDVHGGGRDTDHHGKTSYGVNSEGRADPGSPHDGLHHADTFHGASGSDAPPESPPTPVFAQEAPSITPPPRGQSSGGRAGEGHSARAIPEIKSHYFAFKHRSEEEARAFRAMDQGAHGDGESDDHVPQTPIKRLRLGLSRFAKVTPLHHKR